MDQRWVRVTVAGIFLAFALLLIFGGYKQPYGAGLDGLPFGVLVATWVIVYSVTGYVIGRWWFVALMLVPIAIAIPTGPITADDDQLPVYVAMATITLLFLGPLGIAGVVTRKLRDRYHGDPRRIRSRNQIHGPG